MRFASSPVLPKERASLPSDAVATATPSFRQKPPITTQTTTREETRNEILVYIPK